MTNTNTSYNANGINFVYCKVSGFKLVAYTDFSGLIVPDVVHPIFNCDIYKVSDYIANNQQLSAKEEVLIGLWPLYFLNNNFKCATDINDVGALKLVHKARTLISRLRKLYTYNNEIRNATKNCATFRIATKQQQNLMIQRADLVKQLFQIIPKFVISEENKSDVAAINNYYSVIIDKINSVTNSEDTRKQLSTEAVLTAQNAELRRIAARHQMLAKGTFQLRDSHYSYLAQELGQYISKRGKTVDVNAIALKIKDCLKIGVKIETIDRDFFIRFAEVAKEVLANSSESLSQEAEDSDFIVRRIEQVESSLNSLQGLLGGEVFEVNKVVNGVSYAVVVTGEDWKDSKAILHEAMAAPTAQANLADAITRAKQVLSAKKRK